MNSENTNELAKALAIAQGQMKAASFNRINPHFKNKYADLAAIIEAIRDPLSKSGLGRTQIIESDGNGGLHLKTTLWHQSGQWVSSLYPLPVGAKPQEMGSALTYARRYSLSAIVGIASDEDDDANEAQKVEVAPRKPEVAKAVPLSDPQYDHMMLYVAELDTDRLTKFLQWLNVKSTSEIKAHQYERAMAGLRKAVGRTLGDGAAAPVPDPAPEEVRQ